MKKIASLSIALVLSFLITSLGLPSWDAKARAGESFSVSYHSDHPDVNPWTGTVTDSFTTSQKRVYNVAVSNNLDTSDALNITINPMDNWTLTLDSTPVGDSGLSKVYEVSPRGTITVMITLQAPSSHEDGNYEFTYTIKSNSTGYTYNGLVDITFTARKLYLDVPTELKVPIKGSKEMMCTVENVDTTVHTLDFSVTGSSITEGNAPKDSSWVIELPDNLAVAGNTSMTFNITVYSPTLENKATLTVFTLTVTDNEAAISDEFQITLTPISSVDIEVTYSPSNRVDAEAGGEAVVGVSLYNNGSVSDTFYILPQDLPAGWNITVLSGDDEASMITIGAKSTVELTVRAEVPADAIGGENTIKYNLKGSVEVPINIIVVVPQTFGIDIIKDINTANLTVMPGTNTIPVEVDNTGNSADTVEFSIVASPDWADVSISQNVSNGEFISSKDGKVKFTLNPGKCTIYISVSVSEKSPAAILNFTLYGVSKDDSSGKTYDSETISLIYEKARLSIYGSVKISGQTVSAGEEVRLKFKVHNSADRDSGPITARLYVDGEVVDEKDIDSVGAGENATVELGWVPNLAGDHVIWASVEGDDIISDSVKTDEYRVKVTPSEGSGIPGYDVFTSLVSLFIGVGISVMMMERKRRITKYGRKERHFFRRRKKGDQKGRKGRKKIFGII